MASQVMSLLCPIHGYPDKKMIVSKKCAPAFVDTKSIGLERVGYFDSVPVISLLEFDYFLKERQSPKRGLSPLKGETDVRRRAEQSLFDDIPDRLF